MNERLTAPPLPSAPACYACGEPATGARTFHPAEHRRSQPACAEHATVELPDPGQPEVHVARQVLAAERRRLIHRLHEVQGQLDRLEVPARPVEQPPRPGD